MAKAKAKKKELSLEDALWNCREDVRSFKTIDKNEFDCQFVRSDKPGQITHVRVLVFDLYSE